MKKFLLVTVAVLAVVACKRDDNGEEQPAPPVKADQGPVPTTVNFTYPESSVITTENAIGISSRTITYTVDNARKLLIKIAFSDRGTYTLNYDVNNLLTSVVTTGQSHILSYDAKGLLTKLVLSGSQTATYQYTHNAEGKIVSVTSKADVGIPGRFDEHDYTYDYSIANKAVVTDEDHNPTYPARTYTHTLSGKNVVETKGTDIGTTTYENHDNKLNLGSKSPFTILDLYGNSIPYADKERLVQSSNNPGKKTSHTQYDTLAHTYSYEYNGNVVAKNAEVQAGGLEGTTTITTVYSY